MARTGALAPRLGRGSATRPAAARFRHSSKGAVHDRPFHAPPRHKGVSAGNVAATLAPPDACDVSAKPRNLDDPDASGQILQRGTRLRALWASRPVVVRVHSGALTAEQRCRTQTSHSSGMARLGELEGPAFHAERVLPYLPHGW